MASNQEIVGVWEKNLASLVELAKKLLVEWGIKFNDLLHLFQNVRKDDLQGLIAGTHEIKEKKLDVIRKNLVNDTLLRHLLSDTIDACDGTETLVKATEIFNSGIDCFFENWGTDKPSIATREQVVDVYGMVRKATFGQMFYSLGGTDQDSLCLTQHQIKMFCKKNSGWLRNDGHVTFFLFKVDGQFFVAGVSADPDGFSVGGSRVGFGYNWSDARVVIPKRNI